jgi:hypothetical protein
MPSCLGRFKNVSLVSKPFWQLCLEPELLRGMTVHISGTQVLPRSQVLLQFLIFHAQHVRRLTLGITPPGDADEPAMIVLNALVVACLTACGTAGKLEWLTIPKQTPLGSIAWLPTLRRLQYLRLGAVCHTLQLPSGFSKLTELKYLQLWGDAVRFDPPANQPPSLTFLLLLGQTRTLLPQKVRCCCTRQHAGKRRPILPQKLGGQEAAGRLHSHSPSFSCLLAAPAAHQPPYPLV